MKPAKILFSTEGRIRRRTYWLYSIALTVAYLAIYFGVAVATGTLDTLASDTTSPILDVTEAILSIAMIWPSLCIQIKRWHDRDKSWVWIFINLIPIIGWIWSFVELGCLDGTKGRNKYGNSPKGANHEAVAATFD
ncbi:DUF805 domain-containing protein [Asticcacaulis sp. ZE23SCel15]|jgi:uncharacterized membrane protein YhaH (DUF805 family)|uniref:DUF805 domain-containing protein n=1 Tax=Asticcacaulis sp. ZE23SCel15 TaxID=3059027 RepID=UPI00265D87ED|nr:DUF805 domain-containing protein [Asticcacaulis sp. ZE23SCel15]WKL56676.1 DUF805 domain-containing protein [Asticcacaulis sp. ZE23SCel15]